MSRMVVNTNIGRLWPHCRPKRVRRQEYLTAVQYLPTCQSKLPSARSFNPLSPAAACAPPGAYSPPNEGRRGGRPCPVGRLGNGQHKTCRKAPRHSLRIAALVSRFGFRSLFGEAANTLPLGVGLAMRETDSTGAVAHATVARNSNDPDLSELDQLAASLDYLKLHYGEPNTIGHSPAA